MESSNQSRWGFGSSVNVDSVSLDDRFASSESDREGI